VAPLTGAGLVMVAVAASFGWVVLGAYERASWMARFRISQPRRLLQAHLEMLLMGGLFMAAGLAVPAAPLWLVAVLVYGGVVAPLMFLPVAVGRELTAPLVRVLDRSSLVALSGGWVALAVVAFWR
jgi:hypothetical protein